MTVSEIVKDLLEYKLITTEAALVLLKAESLASININNTVPKWNQAFQPHQAVPTGISNPYYFSTTTNDPMTGTSTTTGGLSVAANELSKVK
jgi:hypothetical protein